MRRAAPAAVESCPPADAPPQLMIMEAMRLSMIDHEEHQRKEAEAKKKQEAEATKQSASATEGSSSGARVSVRAPRRVVC